MKVLFFYIDTQTSSGYTTGLGIALISGYLKRHGVDTELIYYKTKDDFKYSINKIIANTPDIIGFYSTSINWRTVDMLSREIRKKFPDIFQIYGGIHATLIPEVLKEIESLDAICVGYGEKPMLELSKRMEHKNNTLDISGLWIRQNGTTNIVKNPPYFPDNNFDEFLTFDHNIFLEELLRFQKFDFRSYSLDVIFNRVCPFDCSFCCNSELKKIYANRNITPSPAASIEALKVSIQNTNMKFVTIHDDILTLNKKWFREFIERYANEISLPFICNLRANSFDEEDVKLLKRANIFAAWIGIESGNDYIRNEIMNKKLASTQIFRAIELLHRYNIRVRTQNIIGVPYETPECFIDTIKINAAYWPVDAHTLSFFYPYPKTELYELSAREGLIKKGYDLEERIYPALNLPYFPEKKMLFYFNNFCNLVKYQHYRNLLLYIFFVPLNDRTSWIIVQIINFLRSVYKTIRIGIKITVPCRVRRSLKSFLRKVL